MNDLHPGTPPPTGSSRWRDFRFSIWTGMVPVIAIAIFIADWRAGCLYLFALLVGS